MTFQITHICCPPESPTQSGGSSVPIQITTDDLARIAGDLQTLLTRTDDLIAAVAANDPSVTVNIAPDQLDAIRSLLEDKLNQTNALIETVNTNGGTIRTAVEALGATLRDDVGSNIKSIKDTLASLPADLKEYFGDVATGLASTVGELNEVEERLAGIRTTAQQGNDLLRQIQQTLNSKMGLRTKSFWKKTIQIFPTEKRKVRIPAGAVEVKLGSTPDKSCYEFCDNAKVDHFSITDETGVPVHYRPGMAFEHQGMHGEILDPSGEFEINIPQQPGAVFYLFVKYPAESAPSEIVVESPDSDGNAASGEIDQGDSLPDQGVAAEQGSGIDDLPGADLNEPPLPV